MFGRVVESDWSSYLLLPKKVVGTSLNQAVAMLKQFQISRANFSILIECYKYCGSRTEKISQPRKRKNSQKIRINAFTNTKIGINKK